MVHGLESVATSEICRGDEKGRHNALPMALIYRVDHLGRSDFVPRILNFRHNFSMVTRETLNVRAMSISVCNL